MQGHCIKSEAGFTLIELLITVATLGALAGIMLTSYQVYRENAEYALAEQTLRDALTAFETGDADAAPGTVLPMTATGRNGGPVAGALAAILPGAVTPREVVVEALYNHCDTTSGPFDLRGMIISTPCRASTRAQWVSFCGGFQIRNAHMPSPGC
jgi:prepilin-type N-terminal cleavage/methylation domain-containing protein